MKLTKSAVFNPAAVGVAIALIVLFGLFSLWQLPVQLFPNIDRPQISIQTGWRAASPKEIESEILEPQEEVLQGLPGMLEMNASAFSGGSFINLTFDLDTDMQQTLVEIISRLNRVPPLPRDANPPVVSLGGGRGGGNPNDTLSWFFIQILPGTEGGIEEHYRTVEDIVKPAIEAVPGVAGVQSFSGAPEELQIVIDPYRAAELGIQIPTVAGIAGRANDVSGGFVDVGRRQYTLRFEGRYDPAKLGDLVIDWRAGKPVYLRDIADVKINRGDRFNFVVQNGNPAMSINVSKQSGANALQTLTLVKEEVARLRDGPLAERGLSIEQSFDSSVFINRAISLVQQNLIIGVMLAIGILWWFLRKVRATLIVAMAIPCCLLATFIVLQLTGRSLNIISLAGLAFAVGMVLDAAIVVLENIVRLRAGGTDKKQSSVLGATQVWGALLASTATTVAIFIPVMFLKDVEGQLFADLALTIAIAVTLSLFVAVTVLPAIASKWLSETSMQDSHAHYWEKITAKIMALTATPAKRWLIVALLFVVPIGSTWTMLPELDYLPPVKRDAVDGFFVMPPGATIDFIEQEIASPIVERLEPYMSGTKEPALKNYYMIFFGSNFATMGVRVKDQSRVREMENIIRTEVVHNLPDTRVFVQQGDLFGNFGGNRNITMNVQTRDQDKLLEAAQLGMGLIPQSIPGTFVRAQPQPELSQPELRLIPNDQRIIEAGWTRAQIGSLVQVFGDGQYIGEYFDGEKRMNIILRSENWQTPERLEVLPLMTPSGSVVPMGELLTLERTVGPSQIARIDAKRTISLGFSPPDGMTLGTALDILRDQVEPQIKAALPVDGSIQYGGSADSLKTAITTMTGNFIMALLILFMLMSALFRSLRDSFLVVLSLPLATVGGVALIRILGLPLDLLSMIGFIILLGLVVNNAILLVHQTRSAERDGMTRSDAVANALQIRMRPILMSTLTSLFGMLPLLLMPGEGSVIYRGLAAVIVGGMSVSTLFTLVFLPSLLRMGENPAAEAQPNKTAKPSLLNGLKSRLAGAQLRTGK